MAVAPGRTAKPLYNFDAFPCLKWRSPRYVRCSNVDSDDSDGGGSGGSIIDRSVGLIAPRRGQSASERRQGIRFLFKDDDDDGQEGIAAVREKLMFDLKEAANKLKEDFFGVDVAAEQGDDKVDRDDDVSVSAAAAAAAVMKEESLSTLDKEARPWNLRKNKPACDRSRKTKSMRIEEQEKVNFTSPAATRPVRRAPEKKERVKLAVALSRKEIESDFMAMLGKRPPSRPKKRPRPIQKQLDSLFPGLLLGEITTEDYKVQEAPKKGKTR